MHFNWILLQAASNPQQPQGMSLFGFLPIVLVFVVMYFFLIRPQAKKAKEHQKLLDSITAGTEIVTSGGIHGRVKGVKGQNNEILILEIAEGLKVEIDRAAVARVKGGEGK
ncbi:MAG: preprotein translocase subunit YajC [bacterium]|nr:preprotein translocase subunit YajC [bacterium]